MVGRRAQYSHIGTKRTGIAFGTIKRNFTTLQLIVTTENTGYTGFGIIRRRSVGKFDAFRVGNIRGRAQKGFVRHNDGTARVAGVFHRRLRPRDEKRKRKKECARHGDWKKMNE